MNGEDTIAKGNSFSSSQNQENLSEVSLVPCNNYDRSFMMRLFPVPKMEQLKSGPKIVSTGSVSKAVTGPAIGAVDIGVSKSAYFFQVALPGVRKGPDWLIPTDKSVIGRNRSCTSPTYRNSSYGFTSAISISREGLFCCEIDIDGKVYICGVTSTGGRTVERHSRVYEMKFQQQCPPGPFTLSFSLPGPVDPSLFSPNFRSDGILEAVVAKYK